MFGPYFRVRYIGSVATFVLVFRTVGYSVTITVTSDIDTGKYHIIQKTYCGRKSNTNFVKSRSHGSRFYENPFGITYHIQSKHAAFGRASNLYTLMINLKDGSFQYVHIGKAGGMFKDKTYRSTFRIIGYLIELYSNRGCPHYISSLYNKRTCFYIRIQQISQIIKRIAYACQRIGFGLGIIDFSTMCGRSEQLDTCFRRV